MKDSANALLHTGEMTLSASTSSEWRSYRLPEALSSRVFVFKDSLYSVSLQPKAHCGSLQWWAPSARESPKCQVHAVGLGPPKATVGTACVLQLSFHAKGRSLGNSGGLCQLSCLQPLEKGPAVA